VHEPEQRLLHRIGAIAASAGGGTPRRPRLRLAIRLAVTLLVVAFLVITVATQWDELRAEQIELHAIWLAPALSTLVVVDVVAAGGWGLVLRAQGHLLREVRTQSIWAKSLLARYVPGTVLMVVGRVLLAEREGVPRRTTGASMVYEQGLFVVSAVLISGWALLAEVDISSLARFVLFGSAPLLLATMHPRVFGPVANRVLRAFGRDPLPVVLSMRRVLALLTYYLVLWVIFGIGVFFAAQTAYHLSLSDLPAITAAQALGYTAALVTVIFPGGLGVRDTTFALVLDAVLPGGFALAAAIAIAVRLVTTLAEVIYAGGAILIARRAGPAPQPLRQAT
jgi:hypothetical protein